MAPKTRTLSVKGFRSYGAAEQTLNLPGEITAVWGPNSKGKTNLAEAFEFLLTGRISRRELMASSQDEFADALRNAHLSPSEEVYVSAKIIAADSTLHEFKRVLATDYAKRQDCTSRLEVDSMRASNADLEKYGISLSQPPLQAPVLAQHTLSYIFSVRPQDRSTYFKTLLEVTDLDDLRNDIAGLADELKPPEDPLLTKFNACVSLVTLKPILEEISHSIPDSRSLVMKIEEAARTLIEVTDSDVPNTLHERLEMIEKILTDRRSKTFPVNGFERRRLAAWNPPSTEVWDSLDRYVTESEKVEEETRQLVALFSEALKLPAISEITEPILCPLCGTESAMTPERVQLIRKYVECARSYKLAETSAKSALSKLSASSDALASAIEAALPQFLKIKASKRREIGFTVAGMFSLLGSQATDLVNPWLDQVRPLARAGSAVRRSTRKASTLVNEQSRSIASCLEPEKLKSAFDEIAALHTAFEAALNAYDLPANALVESLNGILDAQSDSAGWQDFLDIARKPDKLRALLIERQARAIVEKELDASLKQIDLAKEQVLDDKFSDYSDTIQAWWERLRPEELTYFSSVKPRKGAKRTIDFKAGLSATANRSTPKVRDVIAVFSQSQLHCLGLALFLARAQHEGLGFIILDDPVLSSDEDYRVHFNSTVLSELLKLQIQVIILTQDHDTWEELELRYRHVGISNAQLFIDTPAKGTIIENTSDALLAKINRAGSLARGGHPDLRKECGIQLRDAGERFCKEMLVNDRHGKGDMTASLTDYDSKTLEWLSPRVEPLLGHDPSHPGKLKTFQKTVNRACHDNAPPGNAEMTQACGEIRFLTKDYLNR